MNHAYWFARGLSIYEETRSDERGEFRIVLVDFRKEAETAIRVDNGEISRFGWILFGGDSNHPIVGSEADATVALDRALGVRMAMVRPFEARARLEPSNLCVGCGTAIEDIVEPCPVCGGPTCDACFLDKGNCGCAQLDERAAAIGNDARALANQKMKAAPSPTAGIPTLPSQLEEETIRTQKAANELVAAMEAGDI